MSEKYFRTMHLPYSPGGTNDDKRLKSDAHFKGQDVIITEKMDGSNVCLTRQGVFARSHNGPPKHPSFDALKAFHAARVHGLPPDLSFFGEWCYAKHSLFYETLPSHFLLFAIREDPSDLWLPWDQVVSWAPQLGACTVPVLWQGKLTRNLEAMIEDLLETYPTGKCDADPEVEGVVVRAANGWATTDSPKHIAKWVRADHVQTDDHWKRGAVTRNKVVAS